MASTCASCHRQQPNPAETRAIWPSLRIGGYYFHHKHRMFLKIMLMLARSTRQSQKQHKEEKKNKSKRRRKKERQKKRTLLHFIHPVLCCCAVFLGCVCVCGFDEISLEQQPSAEMCFYMWENGKQLSSSNVTLCNLKQRSFP